MMMMMQQQQEQQEQQEQQQQQPNNIFQRNAYAIQCIREGAYSNAVQELRQALRELAAINNNYINNVNNNNIRINDNDANDEEEQRIVATYPLPVESPTSSIVAKAFREQEPCSFCPYNRAFVLDVKMPASSQLSLSSLATSRVNKERISAVLMYNLGLSHHLMAQSSLLSRGTGGWCRSPPSSSAEGFRKALLFYEMAYEIINVDDDGSSAGCSSVAANQQEQHQQQGAQELDHHHQQQQRERQRQQRQDLVLLVLAIWNNMGAVYAHFLEPIQMQECLSNIQAALLALSTTTAAAPSHQCNRHGEDDPYGHFRMNVFLLHNLSLGSAPAA